MSHGKRGRPPAAPRDRVMRRLRRAVVSRAYAGGWLPERFYPEGDVDAPEQGHEQADVDAEVADLLAKRGEARVSYRSVGDARRAVFPPGRGDGRAYPIGGAKAPEPLTDPSRWQELVALVRLLHGRRR